MNTHYSISLFSGAGGLDLGVEAAGFVTRLCTDIDDFSCKTLNLNKSRQHGSFLRQATIAQRNIKEYSTEEILNDAGLTKEQVDLVYGGPPCQAFSVFGKRQGINDPRGTLLWDYIRVIREIQPRSFIFENVAGILTVDDGRVFDMLKAALETNEAGERCYNLSYALFNTAAYGIPQYRQRVIIYGVRCHEAIPLPAETHYTQPDTPVPGLLPPVTVATFFVVSRHAAKMRMVDVGYEEAIGAFTYIDGHYVKPHAFKKGSLQKDQTYCISADDAQIITFSDMRLYSQVQKGSYIYVDSHMCLNDPKYVTRDENNVVQMTDYGRLHIDECCLVFTLKVKATNKYGEEFYKECVLFRDVDSGIVFQTTFAKEVSDDVMGKADAILARELEIQRVLQELPAQFGPALIYLMDWVEISEETLAEKALVSTKLVQRMRNNPQYPKSIDSVVAICIGMNLPPELSNALIGKSGFTLRLAQNEAHLMYNFFLNHLYMGSIHDCNDMLVAKSLPVMTGTE